MVAHRCHESYDLVFTLKFLLARCFLTLTQALSLGYGGNPYGPAGTGKTESVKALGLALGRQVNRASCATLLTSQATLMLCVQRFKCLR